MAEHAPWKWNWAIPIEYLCGSCDGKEFPVADCWECLGTGRQQDGWEERLGILRVIGSTESERPAVQVPEPMMEALRRVVVAYQAFVEAHGPLVDFSTSAEMVDLDLALGRAAGETV